MLHLTLQQALGQMHLDVLQELERFRLWQRLQRTATSPSLNAMSPQITPDPNGFQRSGQSKQQGASVQRSSPVLIQEVVEDLEVEETQRFGGVFSPWMVLFLWALSCAGIGFGVRWLIWPEELSLPQTSNLPTSEPGIPTEVNLAQLPLIPLGPVETPVGEEFYSGNWDPSRLALGLSTPPDLGNLQIAPLDDTPNLLDSLQTDLVLLEATPPPSLRTVEQLAASLERPSQPTESLIAPPASTSNLDSLGPNQGEGTFLVLTTYLGDESLARARQVADGAFVKDVDGQKFVQLAAFEQLEYARYHAETLKSQGFNVTITEQ
ncbi:hypothetical protein L1047_05560 [Synechococcus sp. Nb3U1]|uniref:hypothetical protein n=1 Tax=Synechococcus sp. Nb3U1 TaxID=1914529 RepID=UPI001F3ED038|nr:hypothetical protein [Synechococcus sp. Nb3U1]MCF2970662.1 hypothetical protein [Synechococcus sp. Nb3U1]